MSLFSPSPRVRWLIAGAFLPTPSGQVFSLAERDWAGCFGQAAHALSVTVPDRIGSSDALFHEVSFDSLNAFQFAEVIGAVPGLGALRTLGAALRGERGLSPEERTALAAALGPGALASEMVQALHGARSSQGGHRAALALLEEALFTTARDILQAPAVARLESSWRGLHWLWELGDACPELDIEVLDVAPHQLEEALARRLEAEPLQRPDVCFIAEELDGPEALRALAQLGEQAWVPVVASVPLALASGGAWTDALRAEESSRWLSAALNPVVMMAERQGSVHRECFAPPALAVAALLTASFRDTRTFARLVGPGSAGQAPAVWRPEARAAVATQAVLSLREQERLAARGLLGVSGGWDSNAVMLGPTAPSLYGGRDAAHLPAQLLTGRLLRLSQAFAASVPEGTRPEAVAASFAPAAEAFLSLGSGKPCPVQARGVSLGGTERGLHVRATLRPELAGTPLQLEFTLPLR
jgi:type VI secretion system protein ImpC